MKIIYTCPKCGGDLREICLTMFPPSYKMQCVSCGWSHQRNSINYDTVKIPFLENDDFSYLIGKNMIFDEIINSIENYDMKEFALKVMESIPEYFWEIGASSSGKYHPTYALGYLGLARHTCALVRILNHALSIECVHQCFTSRERDIMRIAGMMHDTYKSGYPEDYEKDSHTKHEHPLIAAEVVRKYKGCGIISKEEVEVIAKTIETHMGQWTKSDHSDVTLPKPITRLQVMVHLADYLASRKDIEIKFEE